MNPTSLALLALSTLVGCGGGLSDEEIGTSE